MFVTNVTHDASMYVLHTLDAHQQTICRTRSTSVTSKAHVSCSYDVPHMLAIHAFPCTGKQSLKYGTVALTDLLCNGSSKNSIFRVMLRHSGS